MTLPFRYAQIYLTGQHEDAIVTDDVVSNAQLSHRRPKGFADRPRSWRFQRQSQQEC